MKKLQGVFTAIVTPFIDDEVNFHFLRQLIRFNIGCGVDGIVFAGTTGESPTLNFEAHKQLIQVGVEETEGKCFCIAGTGSNNLQEAVELSKYATKQGVDGLLLVDPYYNGPSSYEIMNEYIAPIASRCETEIIPYIVPGRTGCELLPVHLAELNSQFPNVNTVKIAAGNLEKMALIRSLCGPEFTILSGDDDLTALGITRKDIKANGTISVMSNLFPQAIVNMVHFYLIGAYDDGDQYARYLKPVFNAVNVVTKEKTKYGGSKHKARNPVPVKSMMALLGLNVGGCRPPLGKMTRNGANILVDALTAVYSRYSHGFSDLTSFFEIDTEAYLATKELLPLIMYPD